MRTALAGAITATMALVWATTVRGDEPPKPEILTNPPAAEIAVIPRAPLANHAPTTTGPTRRQFVVKCELNRIDDDGEPKPLAVPTIVVTDGQEGHVTIQGQRPFVTGLQAGADNEPTPVVTTLTEGVSGNFTVTLLDDERVQIDASITLSAIDQIDTIAESEDQPAVTQSPQQSIHGWRVVRSMQLGQSIEFATKLGCDGQPGSVVLTVDRLSAEEAAITPIRTSEAEPKTEQNAEPMVTVVYEVADLLQPYAQEKPPGELQDTDLMPVIELLLGQSDVEWSDDAAIRPFAEKRAVVISQTQDAHEKISQMLRDKRDNIAAIERLIR